MDKISYKAIYSQIKEQNGGIQPIWYKVLEMIQDFNKIDEYHPSLKLFCIYFSLLDDGNICICLDPDKLLKRWMSKWQGLLLVSDNEVLPEDLAQNETLFKEIIEKGIDSIKNDECSKIIGTDKLFVVKEIDNEQWLFATKYFEAKESIENRVKALFSKSEKPYSETDKKNIIEYFIKSTVGGFRLNDAQAAVIVRGLESNLIVTGGPGTGKTTAICYLLWKLFENGSTCEYNLYLAAPSGKAAERMKESISNSLNNFSDEIKKSSANIVDKLASIESFTIHRLLSYNPKDNKFKYNSENQFDKKSIFVIDEASMIDIQLFRSLLEAIPDEARVFILGDKDQLPSVQAGAVLGELIAQRTGSLVNLTVSQRFNENSQVGRLKEEVNRESTEQKILTEDELKKFGTKIDSPKSFSFSRTTQNFNQTENQDPNPVYFYEFKDFKENKEQISKNEQLNQILKKWSEVFCEDLVSKSVLERNIGEDNLHNLWKLTNEAKILCAEKQGFRGVWEINEYIAKRVIQQTRVKDDDNGFFVGLPLIITQNQEMFKLYNGDTGIVVSFEGSDAKYLMVEKKTSAEEANAPISFSNKDLVFRIGDFIFYSLTLLPLDSLEKAYSITIHKSQGSGYDNIMVLLPGKEGHPLLNRQIVYTAITRTQKNTYIITSLAALNNAINTQIERDTKISLTE